MRTCEMSASFSTARGTLEHRAPVIAQVTMGETPSCPKLFRRSMSAAGGKCTTWHPLVLVQPACTANAPDEVRFDSLLEEVGDTAPDPFGVSGRVASTVWREESERHVEVQVLWFSLAWGDSVHIHAHDRRVHGVNSQSCFLSNLTARGLRKGRVEWFDVTTWLDPASNPNVIDEHGSVQIL